MDALALTVPTINPPIQKSKCNIENQQCKLFDHRRQQVGAALELYTIYPEVYGWNFTCRVLEF
jgi:hypothetical protein